MIFHVGTSVATPTPATSTGDGGPCPAGFYCPVQTEDPIPCPNTTYRDVQGGAALSDCLLCPQGQYCGSSNLTTPSGPCDPGFFCLDGSNVPNPAGRLLASCSKKQLCYKSIIVMFCLECRSQTCSLDKGALFFQIFIF